MSRKNKMTVDELARIGGNARYKKYGKKGFSEMGKKGHITRIAKDPNYYYHIGQVGIQKRIKAELDRMERTRQIEEERRNPLSVITNLFQGKK